MDDSSVRRREFLKRSAAALGAVGSAGAALPTVEALAAEEAPPPAAALPARPFNGTYDGARLSRVAFPLGGIGAGMICLEGTRRPVACLPAQPSRSVQRAVHLRRDFASRGAADVARVLEGPVPGWKLFGRAARQRRRRHVRTACRVSARRASPARFPFGTVSRCTIRRAAAGRDHRLESVRARRRRQLEPAGRRRWSIASPTSRGVPSKPSSPSTPELHAARRQGPSRPCARLPGGFLLWLDRAAGGRAWRRRGVVAPRSSDPAVR